MDNRCSDLIVINDNFSYESTVLKTTVNHFDFQAQMIENKISNISFVIEMG